MFPSPDPVTDTNHIPVVLVNEVPEFTKLVLTPETLVSDVWNKLPVMVPPADILLEKVAAPDDVFIENWGVLLVPRDIEPFPNINLAELPLAFNIWSS